MIHVMSRAVLAIFRCTNIYQSSTIFATAITLNQRRTHFARFLSVIRIKLSLTLKHPNAKSARLPATENVSSKLINVTRIINLEA